MNSIRTLNQKIIILSVLSSHSRGMGHFFRMCRLFEIAKKENKDVLLITNRYLPAIKLLIRNNINHMSWESEAEYFELIKLIYNKYENVIWINDKFSTSKLEATHHRKYAIKFICVEDRGSGAEYSEKHIVFLPWSDQIINQHNYFDSLNILLVEEKLFKRRRKRNNVNNILISLGGTDTYSITPKVINELKEFPGRITAIIGPGCEIIQNKKETFHNELVIKHNVEDFAAELIDADLLITGGGMTHLEAVTTGLPSLIIAMEDFELVASETMNKIGACRLIGYRGQFEIPDFSTIKIDKMSSQCLNKMDGWSKNAISETFF